MTACDLCKGTGRLIKPWYDTTGLMMGMTGDICFMCDGKGTIGEPQTNEEWFCGLSTEEKAKVLRRKTYGNSEGNESVEQGWVRWLQAKHEDNPPDIPNVPSWDKWLEGERTKCEYCDGTGKGVECNLVGRFECPKTPKTEQEYIQTCTTEQLAEEIYECVMTHPWHISKEVILEWLKQPHRGDGE